jgi:uncharacterized protein (DUF4415 family)
MASAFLIFETLCETPQSNEPALARIAAMVPDLDLKDGRFGAPEAPAIGMVIEGLRLARSDDHALLAEGMTLFEALYAHRHRDRIWDGCEAPDHGKHRSTRPPQIAMPLAAVVRPPGRRYAEADRVRWQRAGQFRRGRRQPAFLPLCERASDYTGGVAMPKRSGSSARGGRVAANARRTARRIDYSDIPESSPAQLNAMRRVGRPPLGDEPRRLIAIRVDPSVLASFRKEARRRHIGYQTLINEVLAEHIRKEVA